jgi:hypothetical protein
MRHLEHARGEALHLLKGRGGSLETNHDGGH